jgi:hypothetical protein
LEQTTENTSDELRAIFWQGALTLIPPQKGVDQQSVMQDEMVREPILLIGVFQ